MPPPPAFAAEGGSFEERGRFAPKAGGGVVRALRQGLCSLLFPARCLSCGSAVEEPLGAPLCPACSSRLPRNRPPWCAACGRSLAGLGAGIDLCRTCRLRKRPLPFDRVISPFLYEGALRDLILALKYRGRLGAAPLLAGWMAQAVRERLGPERLDLCICVPLHRTRLRERTFNQAHALGRPLSRQLGVPYEADLLTRHRATPAQTQLPHRLRRTNLEKAFSIRPHRPVRGLNLLLVDDVLTTGSTAAACAQTLKQAGAARVTVVALAHG